MVTHLLKQGLPLVTRPLGDLPKVDGLRLVAVNALAQCRTGNSVQHNTYIGCNALSEETVRNSIPIVPVETSKFKCTQLHESAAQKFS